MSVSSEVQRTLVKSPPELWAELSDPVALARHLGELGEVRITRVEPEKTVEWEAADATGAVRLKPSGWGTKVTLTVTREVPEPGPIAVEPRPTPEPVVEPGPIAVEAQPTPEPVVEPEPIAESEPAPAMEPESVPRRGFFARLFGRRPQVEPAPEPRVEPAPEPRVEPPLEPEAAADPKPEPEVQDVPQLDLAAELAALEESLVAETQAVLTTVLDRLGAAHHRPFSRS